MFHRKKREIPALNTTSTADISFMLLIFFLVTTSMDIDKGINRMLPPLSKNPDNTVATIDKNMVLAYSITADNHLLLGEKTVSPKEVRNQVIDIVKRLGTKHVITVELDRNADYNIYFQLQNNLVAGYRQVWNETAQKRYGHPFEACTPSQQDVVKKLYPQRIAENYRDEAMGKEDR